MSESYAPLVRQLADLAARVDAERAEADDWYDRQCAAADRAIANAEQAVRRAETEVAAARAEVEAVEAEALHLWQVLRGRLGSAAGRRTGGPPGPAPGATSDPAALLDGVRELLDRTKQRGELPTSAYPLLAMFGLIGAAAAAGLAVLARIAGERSGGELAVGMPVLALVVTLLGPLVGLAPAKLLADRQHAGLDPRAVAAVVLAGLVTTGSLFVLLR
jgi:hypothetical protein